MRPRRRGSDGVRKGGKGGKGSDGKGEERKRKGGTGIGGRGKGWEENELLVGRHPILLVGRHPILTKLVNQTWPMVGVAAISRNLVMATTT